MKKKCLVILLAALLGLALVGCGGGGSHVAVLEDWMITTGGKK